MDKLGSWKVASPCTASWESMRGDDQVRFCGHCSKNVYNLSAMSRSDAEALLRRTEGRVCTHFYRRLDGTILTADCPVGLRAKAARFRRRASVALAGMFGIASAALAQAPQTQAPLIQVETDAKAVLSGVVKDPTGAALANALVVALNPKTGREVKATSDGSGSFRIESLAKAAYIVRISSPGFSTFSKEVNLGPGETAKIEAVLLLGTMGGPMAVKRAK
jgi:hypothetical protein